MPAFRPRPSFARSTCRRSRSNKLNGESIHPRSIEDGGHEFVRRLSLAPSQGDCKIYPEARICKLLSPRLSYYAYFRRFEVDAERSLVRHLITASLDPSETGLTYVRKVALQGDIPSLTTVGDPSDASGSYSRLNGDTFKASLGFLT